MSIRLDTIPALERQEGIGKTITHSVICMHRMLTYDKDISVISVVLITYNLSIRS